MKDRLRSIYQQHGEEPFRHGNMLLNIHNDLFPREEQDRRLLKLLLMCKGNTLLLDARKKAIGEQSVAITRLIKQMQTDWGLQPSVAREVVSAFWLAIGGSPDALNTLEDRMPERAPSPNPAPEKPAIQEMPTDVVCRESDYVIEHALCFRFVKKYIGSDPVIRVPDGITHIGEYAFVKKGILGDWKSSSQVREVYFPETMGRIEPYAFYRCDKLCKISFPCGISRIDAHAFGKCTSLKTVVIPKGVQHIDKNAFVGCSGITVIASDKWKKEHPDLLSYIEHPPQR